MFVTDKVFQPCLMFMGKANIILGWKYLPVTNTLAYYKGFFYLLKEYFLLNGGIKNRES